MSLLHQQMTFAASIPALIHRAIDLDFAVTLGDAYRDPRAPYGSKSSRHRQRLAIDLNLFKKDERGRWIYCRETRDHLELGEYWESIGGIWGGRFNDGNHYEWPIQ